jgi:hydroxymethylbilane synthase
MKILEKINCKETMHCTNQERIFLKQMGGGCSMPISAYAYIKGKELVLRTNVCSIDYKNSISDISKYSKNDEEAGLKSYNKIVKMGAHKFLKSNLK